MNNLHDPTSAAYLDALSARVDRDRAQRGPVARLLASLATLDRCPFCEGGKVHGVTCPVQRAIEDLRDARKRPAA